MVALDPWPRFSSVYRRILVGYRDTEQGHDALALGRVLARANDAELLIASAGRGEENGLAEQARSEKADLIVLGSTHRGPVGRIVPGATVEHLLGEAPCAVAVAPAGFGQHADGDSGWRPLGGDDDDAGLRVIGVGYDGSHAAHRALSIATELAISNGAALRVYAVAINASVQGAPIEAQALGTPTRAEKLREQLHEAVALLPTQARALPVFLWGTPAISLLEATENGLDLMILGSRRGGPLRRALNGSVSSAVIHEAKCPVLISPAGVEAPATHV
jgi:nucleotide-binding universal stress UspA family protein